jgi:hypothetical protein
LDENVPSMPMWAPSGTFIIARGTRIFHNN